MLNLASINNILKTIKQARGLLKLAIENQEIG
jgi:hypothetical protein